jgi:phosphate acetyltransferase
MKGLFIASTGQHVGKTTTSLGIFSGLKKRFPKVGFMKPVGQEQIEVKKGVFVDKDVVLFKDHFKLSSDYSEMSPVLVPPGFTRNFLDGKIDREQLCNQIKSGYSHLSAQNDFTLVEGTGNIGVGSIINLNNAQVASLLGLDVILVAPGGLGSSFDDLALNCALCEKHGVAVKGVILNRVLPDKREMILHYMTKALSRSNIPIFGCIPFDPFLSNPTMKDFEALFEATLLTGEEHHLRHFKHLRLVATSVETYRELIVPNQLIITPANREDIILATLSHNETENLQTGMILTGDLPPRHFIIEELKKAHIPMLFAPVHSYTAMKMIANFTAKIRKEDLEKIHEAIDLVESHVDFNRLLS